MDDELPDPRARHLMAIVDALPVELRLVVYDYGWENVRDVMMKLGITEPHEIREFIETLIEIKMQEKLGGL